MTINYKEKAITGTEWQRCCTVVIQNQYQIPPEIMFQEEKITSIDNNYIRQPVMGSLVISYTPTKTFQVLNPNDNTPTGTTMTHQDVYNILYSLYMQAALERDNPTPP